MAVWSATVHAAISGQPNALPTTGGNIWISPIVARLSNSIRFTRSPYRTIMSFLDTNIHPAFSYVLLQYVFGDKRSRFYRLCCHWGDGPLAAGHEVILLKMRLVLISQCLCLLGLLLSVSTMYTRRKPRRRSGRLTPRYPVGRFSPQPIASQHLQHGNCYNLLAKWKTRLARPFTVHVQMPAGPGAVFVHETVSMVLVPPVVYLIVLTEVKSLC